MRPLVEVLTTTTEWFRERGIPSPRLDAELILARALAQATQEKKRVLVHLGAPW